MKFLVSWILAFLVAKAPPGHTQYGGGLETPEQTQARYEQTAQDLAEVVMSEPSFYSASTKGSDHGLVRTAAAMLGGAYFESGRFAVKVDNGILRGDGGKSVCLMQINVGKGRTRDWNKTLSRWASPYDDAADVQVGWTADELLADRKKCFRAAHHLMKSSVASCSRLGTLEGLRAYASGSCDGGSKESQLRMGVAVRWFGTHIPSFTTADILKPEAPAEPVESMTIPTISML